MKNISIPVALLLLIMVFVYCGPKPTSPKTEPTVTGEKITLDSTSTLLSAVSIQAKSGATLTIDNGTTILMLDTSGTALPVPSGKTVIVALDDGDAATNVGITGIVTVALFRISATVNGNAAELRFISNNATAIAGMPVTGAHWSAVLKDTSIHTGSRISLYRISGSTYTRIGWQYVGIPTRVLAKKSSGGDQQTSVSPDGTGSFQAGSDNGSAPSDQATIPSSGLYWNTYSNIPDTSYDVGGVTVGGPLTVGRCQLVELSTAESVAEFGFAEGVTCATWTNPNDGAQYWCELTQAANGKTTSIKIAATVANIFVLDLDLIRATDRLPIMFGSGAYPDGSGVHAPDGSVLSDPYQDPSLKFGGFKELKFSTKNITEGQKIKAKVTDAGYEISHIMFENNVYQFDVALTLDGRKKIEEDILQKEGWLPVQGSATWRNVGLYDHNDTLFINISSHGSGDKVNTMVQTVAGTFTNAAGDADTVTKMKAIWTYLGSVKSAMATLGNSGTSFSVICSLYTGDNTYIFQPYVMDKYGQESYQTHQIIKAKGTRTPLFVINYKEQRNGVLTIHSVTTTRTHEPDTSVSIHEKTTTINLILTPLQVALKSIQTSASSAATCASSQSCSILSGVSDSTGAVTVSESYQTSAKNCKHELPLIDVGSGSGSMTLNNYGVGRAYVSLLPPGTGTRQYALVVDARTTMAMKATPNNASTGRYYSCADSAWHPTTSSIWPSILLTKDDTPPVLQFNNAASIEDYVAAPNVAASWSFTGTEYGSDSISVTQYDATLTVSAP